jgi:ABC-type lipoprotein export system ATPase subunit
MIIDFCCQNHTMKIELKKVMPFPLASIKHSDESIWGNDIILEPSKKIILNASSGKGKSTFTTTTTGLRNDYDGDIMYEGINIKSYSPDDWSLIRQEKISTVFQDLQLFPKLTVKENLLLKNSLTDTYTEIELIQLLEKLEIDDKWTQLCGLLSMGQQQRVAIIRALSQPFEWLIMDEPFSHLDADNTNRCLAMIDERATKLNAGFVLTTLGDFHNFNYDYELKL